MHYRLHNERCQNDNEVDTKGQAKVASVSVYVTV